MTSNNYSKVETWTISRLVAALQPNGNSQGEKIVIPPYQRGLVWQESARKTFIDSIKQGFPVGALLLSATADGTYSLVDGLQRSTSFKRYFENPAIFVSDVDIKLHLLDSIIQKLQFDNEAKEALPLHILDWLKSCTGFEETQGFSGYKLAQYLKRSINDATWNDEVSEWMIDVSGKINAGIKKASDISRIEIPLIIYTGPQDNLPTIFERLNKEGTKLTKFQIYAATWIGHSLKVNNRDIVDRIRQRYDEFIDEGYEVENFDPQSNDIYTQDFSVFEYVFGLGKHFTNNYPLIFDSNDENRADSVIFNVVTASLGINVKKMGEELPAKVVAINQENFENAIDASIGLVNSQLKPIIGMNANRKKSSNRNPSGAGQSHSDYQIASLITKVFRTKYASDISIRNGSEAKLAGLLPRISKYYLYDILRGHWASAGDTKLNESVSDDSRYNSDISRSAWDAALEEWHENQLSKKETERVRFSSNISLFLKSLYSHILTVYEDTSTQEYHIEHIVPVEILKPLAQTSGGLPISAVSNLCIIPKELNQMKAGKTIYQYVEKQIEDGEMLSTQAEKMIKDYEKFAFVDRSDFDFIASDFTEAAYKTFLATRFEKIRTKLYRWLFPDTA